MGLGLEQDHGSFNYSPGAGTSSPSRQKPGRGISVETCGLDDVFRPDDLDPGRYTPFIIMHISYIKTGLYIIKIGSA